MAKKKFIAYTRVSTGTQTTENQLISIQKYCEAQDWELVKVYEDCGISGAKDDRPALNQLKEDVKEKAFEIDGLICWRFDRVARSSQHLLQILQLLRENDLDFISITEAINTSTSTGKMVFSFLGAIAEFERELIRERVIAGQARARKAGKTWGRKRKAWNFEDAVILRKEGFSITEISKKLEIPRTRVWTSLKRMGI